MHLFQVGIIKGVCDEELNFVVRDAGMVSPEGLLDAEAGDGVWAGLPLEANQPPEQGTELGRDRLCSFFFGDGVGYTIDDIQQVRSCAHRGVDDPDVLRRQPPADAHPVPENRIGEPCHEGDYLVRCVIRSAASPEFGVILFEEVLVQAQVDVRVPLVQVVPVDRADHAQQRAERDAAPLH